MKSSDIIDLFEVIGQGARVYIANMPLRVQPEGQPVPVPVQ